MLLLGNKTMWIVGDNTEKQLGVDTTKDGNTYTATIVEVDLPVDANSSTGDKVEAAALSAGPYNSAFMTADGRAFVWGNNQYYQVLNDAAGEKVSVSISN